MTSNVGSWLYMAPEVFAGEEGESDTYNEKIDVYSYSMLLYELLTDCLPFSEGGSPDVDKSSARLGIWVVQGKRPDEGLIPGDCPEAMRVTMRRSWDADPHARPLFRDIHG